jgi:hypothetical protein
MISLRRSDIIYISIISLILPISYYYYITKYSKISVDKLWGKLDQKSRQVNTVSIGVIALAYIIAFFTYITYNKYHKWDREMILLGYTGFILFSFMWMPLSYQYLMGNKTVKYYLIYSLGLVTFFALLLFLVMRRLKVNIISKLATFYMFFHTFLFDFILWNIGFL